MRAPGIALTSVVVIVALLTVACGSRANVDNAGRDPASGAITKQGDVGTQRLRVGDCFNEPDGATVLVVTGVPCADRHEGQVVAVADLSDGTTIEWPGETRLGERSRSLCLDAVGKVLNGNFTDPMVGLSAYVPDKNSWESSDRRIVCILGRLDGSAMTGSLLAQST